MLLKDTAKAPNVSLDRNINVDRNIDHRNIGNIGNIGHSDQNISKLRSRRSNFNPSGKGVVKGNKIACGPHRPSSGRKPAIVGPLKQSVQALNSLWTAHDDRLPNLIAKIFELAMSGSIEHMKIYLERRFGKVREEHLLLGRIEHINITLESLATRPQVVQMVPALQEGPPGPDTYIGSAGPGKGGGVGS